MELRINWIGWITTHQDALEGCDNACSCVESDVVDKDSGPHTGNESTRAAERWPETSNQAVHCRV